MPSVFLEGWPLKTCNLQPNEVSGQSSPQEALASFKKETSVEDRRYRASLRGEELSSSLLGIWPHVANDSSRSRL